MTCPHTNRYGYEEPHEPQPPSAGNFCVKTVRVWCEDCGELIWQYEVYLDGTIFTIVDAKRGEHRREEDEPL